MPKTINKFWNFVAAAGEKPAELILYGDISSYSWWGDEVTPAEFNKELCALGDISEIVVRINSGGGDVFAANAIYTRLKDHKAKITVKIDGWAASAATIIAMAGDVIMIPASGVFMIHKPMYGIYGWYNEDEFNKMSDELAVIKNSMINAYALKTGIDKEEIAALMTAETWYTGEEAVAAGFCDEVMFAEVQALAIAASAKSYKNPPKALLNLPAGGVANKITKGDKSMDIRTVEDLKAAYPELVAQVESAAADAAAKAERERIKAIEDCAPAGFEEAVAKAKFTEPVTAEALAVKILAQQKAQGGQYLEDRAKDIAASGIEGVKPEGSEQGSGAASTPSEKIAKAKAEVKKLLGKEKKEGN
jgi:ATP-dependent protease ClpP protease subunit